MQWNEVSEALRTARGHDDGADVYMIDPDGDYVPVTAVEVHSVQGRNLIVLTPDYDNYLEATPLGDNAAASELPDNRNVGDPAIQAPDDNTSTTSPGDQQYGEAQASINEPPHEPGSIPGAV